MYLNAYFISFKDYSKVRAMHAVQLKDTKRCNDLMLVLGLNETIDQLAMANSVSWYGNVLRREDGHVLKRALDFEVVGQLKKGRKEEKDKKKKSVERKEG